MDRPPIHRPIHRQGVGAGLPGGGAGQPRPPRRAVPAHGARPPGDRRASGQARHDPERRGRQQRLLQPRGRAPGGQRPDGGGSHPALQGPRLPDPPDLHRLGGHQPPRRRRHLRCRPQGVRARLSRHSRDGALASLPGGVQDRDALRRGHRRHPGAAEPPPGRPQLPRLPGHGGGGGVPELLHQLRRIGRAGLAGHRLDPGVGPGSWAAAGSTAT